MEFLIWTKQSLNAVKVAVDIFFGLQVLGSKGSKSCWDLGLDSLLKCFLRLSRRWTVRGPRTKVCMISSKMRSTLRNSSEFNCKV